MNYRPLLVSGTVAVALSGVFLLLTGRLPLPLSSNSELAAQLQIGQQVYADQCAACHGANLEGQPNWQSPGPDGLMPAPPHDETGHTWHHTTELLFAITKYGIVEAANLEGYESAMPAYDDVLTDGEIGAVLAFIKSQWPVELQEQHSRLDERARN
jgi:mono/diheme cytochrome c family protein